jgi:ceramide glucosyltransferase
MTIEFALSFFALTALTFSTLARLAFLELRVRRRRPAPPQLPPISILKPLKGLEPGLEENLEALLHQDYPEFEVICGAADPRDPALVVARRVAARHPHRRVVVTSGAPELGLNPKVSNLAHLSRFAQHPWWLISDANVRPDPGYLRAIGGEAAAGADLVHSPLRGEGGSGLGGICEDLHLFGFVLSAVHLASRIGRHPTVIGKSMLFKKDDLGSVGGFTRVKDVLAEDYLLGQYFHRAGLKVVLSAHVLPTPTGPRPLSELWNRHLRWGQMRRRISPWSFLAEPLLSPLLPILAWGLVAPGKGALLALLFWAALELVTRWSLGCRGGWSRYLLMPIRDLMVTALWVVAAFRTTVNWRGRAMTIGAGSVLAPKGPELNPEPLPGPLS